jgi:hypothetical protein
MKKVQFTHDEIYISGRPEGGSVTAWFWPCDEPGIDHIYFGSSLEGVLKAVHAIDEMEVGEKRWVETKIGRNQIQKLDKNLMQLQAWGYMRDEQIDIRHLIITIEVLKTIKRLMFEEDPELLNPEKYFIYIRGSTWKKFKRE